jgi:hypothetical protein
MVQFFEKRLMRHKSLTEGGTVTDYKPVPYSDSWSTLGAARESPEYGAAIGAFIDLLRRFPEYDLYLAPILWHMATLDETTLSALDGLLHEDGDAAATIATQILRNGPRGIALSQCSFTTHLLEVCSAKGEVLEQHARSVLFTNVVYGAGGQGLCRPYPPTTRSQLSVSSGRVERPVRFGKFSPSVLRRSRQHPAGHDSVSSLRPIR